jgi:hypothetical protein
MRHKDLLIDASGKQRNCDCDGELRGLYADFSMDVMWIVYKCLKCGKEIWTVEGGKHWWNFEKPSKT